MSTNQATVETLTAEVRVLTVGNRQITQSVAKQLDFAPYEDVEPFGRVRLTGKGFDDGKGDHRLWVIGQHKSTGALVRSTPPDTRPDTVIRDHHLPEGEHFTIGWMVGGRDEYEKIFHFFTAFPEIVGPDGEPWKFRVRCKSTEKTFAPLRKYNEETGQMEYANSIGPDHESGRRITYSGNMAKLCAAFHSQAEKDWSRIRTMREAQALPLIVLAGLR